MSLADASGAFVIECGGLAARSVTGPRLYVEALTPLLSGSPPDAEGGWRLVPLPVASDCRPGAVCLLALDVEMIERRADGLRLPIRASILSLALGDGGDHASFSESNPHALTIFDGLVDPSAVDASWAIDGERWNYKSEFTGVSAEELRIARDRGTMTPLADLQRQIIDAMRGHACFLVGHNLPSDLKAVRLHGPALRRRIIDTQAIYEYAGGGRPSLRSLVGALLPQSWGGFQVGSHSPADDANAALQLVVRELQLLASDGGRAVGAWTPLDADATAAPAALAKLLIPESEVGRLIGKGGKQINSIRQLTGCTLSLAARVEGATPPPRLLVVSGEAEGVRAAVARVRAACATAADLPDYDAMLP